MSKIKKWWLERVRLFYVRSHCKSWNHSYTVGRSTYSSSVVFKCLTCGKGVMFDDVVWVAIEFENGDNIDKYVMKKFKELGFTDELFEA